MDGVRRLRGELWKQAVGRGATSFEAMLEAALAAEESSQEELQAPG